MSNVLGSYLTIKEYLAFVEMIDLRRVKIIEINYINCTFYVISLHSLGNKEVILKFNLRFNFRHV